MSQASERASHSVWSSLRPFSGYLGPGPGAPSGWAALRVAGLVTGGCRLRAQAGRDGLVTVVRPPRTLHRSALSAPATRPAACAPVSYGPAGRGQGTQKTTVREGWRHGSKSVDTCMC